jgi:hypothetical protein
MNLVIIKCVTAVKLAHVYVRTCVPPPFQTAQQIPYNYLTIYNAVATLTAMKLSRTGMCSVRVTRPAEQVQYVEPQEDHTFLWPLSP